MEFVGKEIISHAFTEYHSSEFGKCLYNKSLKIGLCVAKVPYIPIDHFMDLFKNNGDMIEKFNLKAFIFDKRELRAFHQPSMEWYYIEWKQDMLKLGLKDHFKILPNEEWFKKCVEAGKNEIEEAYPKYKLDQFNVYYVENIQEAIDQFTKSVFVS